MRFKPLRAASDEMLHLDFLRFIASSGIVFHHSHEFLTPINRRYEIERSHGLALLVDLFFLISGFVISTIYRDKLATPPDILRFWQRRIARLVPLHWLVLPLTVAVWALATRFASGNHTPSFKPSCIAGNALFLNPIFQLCGSYQFNGVTWSISAELVLYAVFPVIAFVAIRWRAFPLVSGIVILAALLFHFSSDLNGSTTFYTDLHPVLRAVPSFLIGAGAACVRIPQLPLPSLLVILSTAAMLACMYSGAPAWVQLMMVYLVGFAGISADRSGQANRFIRAVAPLGQLTYSLYMWHALIILVALNFIGDKFLHGGFMVMLALTVICYAVIGAWSYFSFQFIETPARRWVDSLFRGTRRLHGMPPEAGVNDRPT